MKLYKTKEVAEMAGVNSASISRWATEGKIPHGKFGKGYVFSDEELKVVLSFAEQVKKTQKYQSSLANVERAIEARRGQLKNDDPPTVLILERIAIAVEKLVDLWTPK